MSESMLVARHEVDGQHPVIWKRREDGKHVISYGCISTVMATPLEAADEFRSCLQQQLEDDGEVGS